mgnify:CR=1 FL=1
MIPFYDFVAKQFIGKKVHFKCNCIVGLDVTGICISYEIAKTEIVFIVESNNKHIRIGSNTPNLQIELL